MSTQVQVWKSERVSAGTGAIFESGTAENHNEIENYISSKRVGFDPGIRPE